MFAFQFKKIIALASAAGLLSAAGGCANYSGAAAFDRCADGYERERTGPRGQAPKYICRKAS